MYLLYADETNLTPRAGSFFVYAGLAIPGEHAKTLHDAIEAIRNEYGINRDEDLKFNPRPAGLTHAQFIEVKRRVIEAAVQSHAILLTDLVLHNIAIGPDVARLYGINRIAYHFDCLMHRANSHGLMLIDRCPDRQVEAHLREKFFVGVTGMPFGAEYRLTKVVGCHYSAIGQSHFASVIDIVIGAFRWAVESFTTANAATMPTAAEIIQSLAPLFREDDGELCSLALHFSPQEVRVAEYQRQYDALAEFLRENGIRP